ncbi:hypothetical protein C8R43DRAFT_1116169 [Mycena crocata]|nr:hypothetical protein C8R43DRAFT_1116169 [Mycena crocata]
MRFITAIYVSSALFLAATAAPLAEISRAAVEARTENDHTESLTGPDIFSELDLSVRMPTEGLNLDPQAGAAKAEVPGLRDPSTNGCIVA